MVVPPSTGGATFAAVNRPPAASSPTDTPTNGASDLKSKEIEVAKPPPAMAPAVPLSARRANALDLGTVERRGQPTQVHLPPKRTRLHDIPEAPVYRPTEQEWRDPMEYMHKIAPEGRNYGIIKIIPPDSWNPPFAIDTTRFHFRVRRQELNSVEGGTRSNLNYLDALAKFHRQHGTTLTRFPSVDKRPLDLYKLKKAVEARGGFEDVCKLKKWAEIGRDLGYSGKIMSSLSTSLKNSYQKWLQPYEQYLRLAKPGVQQQIELDNGGPFTPSPGPSPTRQQSSLNGTPAEDHLAVQASSAALHASVNGTPPSNGIAHPSEPQQPPTSVPSQPPKPTGFTPVNSTGFTAVNQLSGGFTAVNGAASFRSYPSNGHAASPAPTLKAEATPPPVAANSPPVPELQHAELPGILKRQISHTDSLNGDDGRRSKRQRKDDPPMVVGSNMHQSRNGNGRYPNPRDRSSEKPGENCENCGLGPNPGRLLICSTCDGGYHPECLNPNIAKPDLDWSCPKCLVGTGEFGFEEGEVYSLKQFQERALRFKDNHFADKLKIDPVTNKPKPVSEDDVEHEFWRLVENITETVEVEYGADIHSTTHGSGFPTIEKQPRDQYATDPWNLNVLPLYGESLFRHIKSDISGMTVPWLYVGMVFSTFCWHNEDHYAYSANYQHFGATKTWYGIPAEDAERFEQAMREAVPELFETQPDLLFQLVTLLPPEKLRKAGVRVYVVDQRAGEMVITFPQAYHAGFNHGFNFNEAVNFAPTDWEPYGEAGVQRLQMYRRQPCFSHDELLLTAALRDTSIKTSKWLGPALERIMQREVAARADFTTWRGPEEFGVKYDDDVYRGPRYERPASDEREALEEEQYICCFCKCFTYLSRYVCMKTRKVMCMLHAGAYNCCGDKEIWRYSGTHMEHVLHYRMTDAALKDLVAKVIEKGRLPEAWTEKVEALLLDEPRPQLKTLRTLLHEGERIPYDLPRLHDLRLFVERCNEWVEEATNYITRKPSRRKSDKPGRKSFARQSEIDDQTKQFRNIDNIRKLLIEAEDISFECPEIETLQERAEKIEDFQRSARDLLMDPQRHPVQEYEDLCEIGKTFNVDMPEMDQLEKLLDRIKWREEAHEKRGKPQTKVEVTDLIKRGVDLGLPEHDMDMGFYVHFKAEGDGWDHKARDLLQHEHVNIHQIEILAQHGTLLPVDPAILTDVQDICKKQREAAEKVASLCDRVADPDFRQRPSYKEAKDMIDSLQEINNKPARMVDLERHQRRHEDWMRKGKKLFGKTNAPLHILLQHMEIVKARNEGCFDLEDKPRMPVEPSSREVTPVGGGMPGEKQSNGVFCICRKSEAGMMIECEICHEWYHGKCLKLARGKVKEDDRYKCPICDWRQKIPRDAARPKLEELQNWHDDLEMLPFQPDEEQCLIDLIDTAQTFRDYIAPYINPISVSPEEVPTMRFYLRKVEGADILLAHETNFLRQELHRMAPVSDVAPPTIEHSGSTRKPRPTKIQKLMAQFNVTNPQDLPEQYRARPSTKRKIMESLERMERERAEAEGRPPQTSMDSPFEEGGKSGSPAAQQQSQTPPPPPQPNPGQGMPGLTYSESQPSASGPYRDAPMFSHSSSFTGSGNVGADTERESVPPPPISAPRVSSSTNAANSAANDDGMANLDPALFGPGPPMESPARNKELEDKLFADMVQDQEESPAAAQGERQHHGGGAAALATEALRGAMGE